jgi:L-arabinokinase
MTTITFYISGHGFGHASRQQAIIRHLSDADVRVHVKTPTPQKFFNFPNVTYHHQRYDIGLIQPDSLSVDVEATFQWFREFLASQVHLIDEEVAFIHEQGVQLIVSDMPPIAFEIADQANIPSIACTHFTWDWVYGQYLPEYDHHADIVNTLKASYNKATLALQMPFAHEFDMFSQIEEIPLVINLPTESKQALRQSFNVPEHHKVCLLSMGGMAWGDNDVSALREIEGWTFWVMPDMWEHVSDLSYCHLIPTDYPNYQNLIAAADVLVGKAGWSTVAEVIAHRTPMLYTVRTGYSENTLLVDALERLMPIAAMSKSRRFQSGEWVAYLDELHNRDYHMDRYSHQWCRNRRHAYD